MAFKILEASIERVTEVRDKMQRSFEDVKSSDSDKVCVIQFLSRLTLQIKNRNYDHSVTRHVYECF